MLFTVILHASDHLLRNSCLVEMKRSPLPMNFYPCMLIGILIHCRISIMNKILCPALIVCTINVTGSAKTDLITQDGKFDFFTQTQSFMNALSNFTVTVDQGKFLLAAFLKHSGELCELSGTLMEPWLMRRWLCVAVRLRGIG